MMLTDDQAFEAQLRADFLAEASDLLREIEADFLKLERQPESQPLIDRIFRMVHTIKGSAAVAGFPALAAFAHIFETLLGRIRERKATYTATTADVMLKGVDVLSRFVGQLRLDPGGSVDASDVEASIQALLTGPSRAEQPTGAPPVPQTPPDADHVAAKSASKILVVDDMVEMNKLVADMLEPLGATILFAGTGPEGLRLWRENPDIDVLITDQRMPGMDGTEMVRKMRETDTDLPVVFLSGMTERSDALEYVNLGVFQFLDKPAEANILLAVVKQAQRLGRYKRAVTELSKLSIRSFMTFRRVVVELDGSPFTGSPSVERLSKLLHEMGLLVTAVMSSDRTQISKHGAAT